MHSLQMTCSGEAKTYPSSDEKKTINKQLLKVIYIAACQAHPALVKIYLVLAGLFHFNSLLFLITLS